MIATQQVCLRKVPEQQLQAGQTAGSTVDQIAIDDQSICLPADDVFEHGLQSGGIAVDVGDDCQFHIDRVAEKSLLFYQEAEQVAVLCGTRFPA